MRKSLTPSCLIIAAMFGIASFAIHADENMRGEAFSDPDYIKAMPEAWQQQQIEHPQHKDADLVIALGQQTYPALHRFLEELAAKKGLKVVVQEGSCGVTARKLSGKTADIGAYCCPPGRTDRLPGLEFHTIGIASIALVTHPDNPLEDVSEDVARRIFTGEYVRWSEVPAIEKPQLFDKQIQPVARLHCKKRPGHWRLLLKNEDLFSPRVYEVGVIPDMIKQVAENPAAIGFETLYMLEVYKKNGTLKALSIDGNRPDDFSKLLHGDYPLYRTYSLTTWAGNTKRNELARAFVKEVMAHIETHHQKYGFVPVSALRKAGWKFKGEELISAPDGSHLVHEH